MGFGPDLKGLFVQSNFGVVTAVRIPLLPKPERFESALQVWAVQARCREPRGPADPVPDAALWRELQAARAVDAGAAARKAPSQDRIAEAVRAARVQSVAGAMRASVARMASCWATRWLSRRWAMRASV